MRIRIDNIEMQAVVGTMHHERNNSQKILIDIEFEYDAKQAADTDRLEHAVDYSDIVGKTLTAAKAERYYLLETLAEKILKLVMSYQQITSASVEIRKPTALKNAGFVSAKAAF